MEYINMLVKYILLNILSGISLLTYYFEDEGRGWGWVGY